MILTVGDCFEADILDANENYTKQVFNISHFGYRGHKGFPTTIYSNLWSKSQNEWTHGRLFELTTEDSYAYTVNSITMCQCPSLPPKGGKKTRLKSKKNNSKKTRRITRRR